MTQGVIIRAFDLLLSGLYRRLQSYTESASIDLLIDVRGLSYRCSFTAGRELWILANKPLTLPRRFLFDLV